jgi:O-antigen ligase
MLTSRGFRVGYPAIVLFTLLAGDAWRYTIGWIGWGALVLVLAGFGVALLVRSRSSWTIGTLPYPLLAFLLLATLSIVWSFYPSATLLGLAGLFATAVPAIGVAISFSWPGLLAALATAVRAILGLSFAFELYVSLIHRAPILPLIPQPGIVYSQLNPVPEMLYWSRNQLFEVFSGGKIQGIVGNSVLLSFVALIGIIVFSLRWAARSSGPRSSIFWLAIAGLALAFSRSATVIAALVVVAIVAGAVVLLRRATTARVRRVTSASIVGGIVALAAIAVVFQKQLLAVLGKSEDLTGRLDIWATVINLAQQRPVIGWGWVSQWVPWVAPFDTLVFRNGVRQLHAHNSWIDIWFQLGVLGLVVFGALVLSTLVRSWLLAIDHPQRSALRPLPFAVESMLALLVLTALLVQSLAESKLLVEFGLFFLVLAAVKTKSDARSGELSLSDG